MHLYMHRDAGPPNWKCIFIHFQFGGPGPKFIYLNTKRPADNKIDRNQIK